MGSAKPQINRPKECFPPGPSRHGLRSGPRDALSATFWLAWGVSGWHSLPGWAQEHAPWREKARGRTSLQNSWVHFPVNQRGEWRQQKPVGLRVLLTGNAAGGKTARGIFLEPSLDCESQAFPLNSPFPLKTQVGLLNIPETLHASAEILTYYCSPPFIPGCTAFALGVFMFLKLGCIL